MPAVSLDSFQKEIEIFLGERRSATMRARPFQDGVIELQFLLLQFHHFFFDGMTHEQPHDGHFLGLPDAMRPVRRLIFHGRVPPGV